MGSVESVRSEEFLPTEPGARTFAVVSMSREAAFSGSLPRTLSYPQNGKCLWEGGREVKISERTRG